jgi:hypothetical protein
LIIFPWDITPISLDTEIFIGDVPTIFPPSQAEQIGKPMQKNVEESAERFIPEPPILGNYKIRVMLRKDS